MADRYPERILQRLLQEFQPASSRPSPDRAPSLEIRLKMGEVLMRASRVMGNLTRKFPSLICLISAFVLMFSRPPVMISSICSVFLRRSNSTSRLPFGWCLPAGNQGSRPKHPGQQSVQPGSALSEAGLLAWATGARGAKAGTS